MNANHWCSAMTNALLLFAYTLEQHEPLPITEAMMLTRTLLGELQTHELQELVPKCEHYRESIRLMLDEHFMADAVHSSNGGDSLLAPQLRLAAREIHELWALPV